MVAMLVLYHPVWLSLCFSSLYPCLLVYACVFMCLFMPSSSVPTYNLVWVRTRLLCMRSQILFWNFAWWHMCRLYSNIMELGMPIQINICPFMTHFLVSLSNNMFVCPFYVLLFLVCPLLFFLCFFVITFACLLILCFFSCFMFTLGARV